MTSQPVAPRTQLEPLTLAALGVVFGDIGTSPLYAFKEAFGGTRPLPLDTSHVLAMLSALLWSVMLMISGKYVGIVLRFDNRGEGGVLALTALAHRLGSAAGQRVGWVVIAGVFAAALFYGDAMITPAISVLSAVEGSAEIMPGARRLVVPVTVLILVALFAFQRAGTARVGRLFGPVTVVWFLTLGAAGVACILRQPVVLTAINPLYAFRFMLEEPGSMFVLLSSVFLALTGGEALYADMGHFGAKPIRLAWYGLVCPSLLLNYFGQGALVLADPTAIRNPLFLMVPADLRLGLVLLATAATVIASQATISGAYSITLQASRLGYLPRIRILHTSDTEIGQIYVPSANWLMLLAVLWLVLAFRSSGALAAAYGIAVSGTMMITTLLMFSVWRATRVGNRWLLGMLSMLGLLEAFFLASNLLKLSEGGWLPLVIGALIFLLLTTWKTGSHRVAEQRRRLDIPMDSFVANPMPEVPRVAGTAVYLTSDLKLVPSALFHILKHFRVMHEETVFLNVIFDEIPRVAPTERLRLRQLGPRLHAVELHFGFREEPNVPAAVAALADHGIDINPFRTTYFIARSMVIEGPGDMPRWRCALFAWMTRQAEGAASYFGLPANQVVELGTQVMI